MDQFLAGFAVGIAFALMLAFKMSPEINSIFLPLMININWFLSRGGSTELLFFPDANMPCYSYYDRNKCRNPRCTFLHDRKNEKSSLIKMMNSLRGAELIELCMYRFTLPRVAELLKELHKNGTKIRIITDNPIETIDHNQIPGLKEAGIEVREKQPDRNAEGWRPLMHNKFVIIDRKCCLLGSFNWTSMAVTKNHETVIKSYEPTVVAPLAQKFVEMWNELR